VYNEKLLITIPAGTILLAATGGSVNDVTPIHLHRHDTGLGLYAAHLPDFDRTLPFTIAWYLATFILNNMLTVITGQFSRSQCSYVLSIHIYSCENLDPVQGDRSRSGKTPATEPVPQGKSHNVSRLSHPQSPFVISNRNITEIVSSLG